MDGSIFTAILRKAFSKSSRSTALKPLAWLVGLCAPSSIGAFHYNVPYWVGTMFGILSAVAIVTYIAAYIYFMFKDPNALRSENYLIQQLAIEKAFVGDSEAGYIQTEGLTVRGERLDLVDGPSEGKKE